MFTVSTLNRHLYNAYVLLCSCCLHSLLLEMIQLIMSLLIRFLCLWNWFKYICSRKHQMARENSCRNLVKFIMPFLLGEPHPLEKSLEWLVSIPVFRYIQWFYYNEEAPMGSSCCTSAAGAASVRANMALVAVAAHLKPMTGRIAGGWYTMFHLWRSHHLGVSKNRGGPPKWMVYFMENPMNKWMIWRVFPLFLETPIFTKLHKSQ